MAPILGPRKHATGLVFLKLYRCHMERCHQSYDLRDDPDNPFLLAFARMAVAGEDWNQWEVFPSCQIMSWLDLHYYQRDDKRFEPEIKRIRDVEHRLQAEFEASNAKAATRAAPPN